VNRCLRDILYNNGNNESTPLWETICVSLPSRFSCQTLLIHYQSPNNRHSCVHKTKNLGISQWLYPCSIFGAHPPQPWSWQLWYTIYIQSPKSLHCKLLNLYWPLHHVRHILQPYKIMIVSHMTLYVSLSGTLAVKCAHCAFCLNQQPHQPIITHSTAQQSCILQSWYDSQQ